MDPKEEQIQELKQYLQKANDYILEIKNRLQYTENQLVIQKQNFLNAKQLNEEFELKLQDAEDHVKSQQLDIAALQNKEKNYKNQIEILQNQQKNCPYCNTKYVQNRDTCRPSFRSSNQRNTYKNNKNQNNDNQYLKYNNSDISEELNKNSDQNNMVIQQNEEKQQQQDENHNNQENEFQTSYIMRVNQQNKGDNEQEFLCELAKSQGQNEEALLMEQLLIQQSIQYSKLQQKKEKTLKEGQISDIQASDMLMRKVETNEFGNLEKTTTYQNRQDFQDKGYMQKKNMSQLNQREENQQYGSNQQRNQFNLIEAFAIVSADLKDMEQIKNIDQSLELDPKIIYQFAKKEEIIKQQLEILPNLCFPEGISVKKMQKTQSLSQIEEILLSINRVNKYENCYVFQLKNEYIQQKIQKSNVINDLNNQGNLFAVCVEIDDFYNDPKNKKCYYKMKQVYCFLTCVPFIDLFIDILNGILNKIKLERMGLEHEKADLQKIKNIQPYIEQDLLKLFGKINFEYDKRIELNLNWQDNKKFQFLIPEKEKSHTVQAQWAMLYAFTYLQQESFVAILLLLCQEQNICFVSQSKTLISSFMLLFLTALKPFKCEQTTIFFIFNQFHDIFDSPSPIFVGLNKQFNFIIDQQYEKKYEDVLFLNLDRLKLKNIDRIVTESVFFKILISDLQPHFEVIQNVQQKYYKDRQNGIFIPQDDEIEAGKQILETTYNFIIKQILNDLPADPPLKQQKFGKGEMLDYEQITNKLLDRGFQDTDPLLQSIFKTQMFHKYLEDYYNL